MKKKKEIDRLKEELREESVNRTLSKWKKGVIE